MIREEKESESYLVLVHFFLQHHRHGVVLLLLPQAIVPHEDNLLKLVHPAPV